MTLTKRALTDKDKEDIVHDLLLIWKRNPSLRLGQLIGNVYHYPSGDDPYYVEDHDFLRSIEKYYDSNNIHN